MTETRVMRKRNFDQFKKVMLAAHPGQHISYYVGVNLAEMRQFDEELNKIAQYVMALCALGVARSYQKREGDFISYYVVLTEKLTIRRDQQGTFQEADRIRSEQ